MSQILQSFGKIGVAGCGRMGAPMLTCLRKAGFPATGFDPVHKADLTGICTAQVDEFASDLSVVFTVVRDAEQTDDLLFDVQALLTRSDALHTVVICSTLSPNYVTGLRARVPAHISLVDAPMSGAAIAAQDARLSFMLGGATETLDALMPLFSAMGSSFHRMGAYGNGMQAKVLNNLLAATNTALTRQILVWGKDAGLDEGHLLALIDASSGQNWFASGYDDIEFSRDGWAPDNTIGILTKDIDAALSALPDKADTGIVKAARNVLRTLPKR